MASLVVWEIRVERIKAMDDVRAKSEMFETRLDVVLSERPPRTLLEVDEAEDARSLSSVVHVDLQVGDVCAGPSSPDESRLVGSTQVLDNRSDADVEGEREDGGVDIDEGNLAVAG